MADFTYRPDGLTVSFSGAASYDPDAGDRVTRWEWDFGDGTTADTTTPTTTHTYAAEGPVQVTLRVVDSHGRASAETSKTVHPGEHPPSLVITEPDADARFAVGQTVQLTAEASDAEDGALPGSAITWTLRLRHGNHFHPYLGPVGGRIRDDHLSGARGPRGRADEPAGGHREGCGLPRADHHSQACPATASRRRSPSAPRPPAGAW